MDILGRGSRGFKVELLQRLLNKAAVRERAGGKPLEVDGIFGPLTEGAVRAFQARHRPLKVDGVVGAHTWPAVGLRYDFDHLQVRQFGQPTGTSCWSAAATMIVGNMSVGPGRAAVAPGGGMVNSAENFRAFASGLGWEAPNISPGIVQLATYMRRTPVWIAGGGANWSHAVVLSGMWSDGDMNGDGTMLRIHDPWPVNRGRVYGSFANPIMMFAADGVTRVPASLEYMLVPR